MFPGFDHFGDGVGAVGARTHDPAHEPAVDGPTRRPGSLSGEFADVPVDFEELAEGVDWKRSILRIGGKKPKYFLQKVTKAVLDAYIRLVTAEYNRSLRLGYHVPGWIIQTSRALIKNAPP